VIRLTDSERDTAVRLLQDAFAQGRLDSHELEARLERVLTATFPGELEPVLAGLPDDVVELSSTNGRVTRTGDWRVPRVLRIVSEYGRVRLDLSRAAIHHAEIHIELRLEYGSAIIILPRGATANADDARTRWGTVTSKVRERPGRTHVRVSGELGYGRLRIRYRRAWAGRGLTA
jgi:hypothetical protein